MKLVYKNRESNLKSCRYSILFYAFFLSMLSVLILSCDHTELSGKITPENANLKVGEEFELILEIPPELDGIYRVHWDIEPIGSASLEYQECSDGECEPDSGYVFDRKARITPLKTGPLKVFVSGFYRQTNPQGIVTQTFMVRE